MVSWPAKDPDSVLDYVYTVQLDAGDTVSGTPTATLLSGTVVIDSTSFDPTIVSTPAIPRGQSLTLWLSGGTAGETAVIRIAWSTAGGRTNDDVATLAIIESDIAEPLPLTGYAKPAPGHLTARYPAFAATPAATIQYWLTDAERSVDNSWTETDYAAALMAVAAHNMALAGYGTDVSALAAVPGGVSRLRSGSLDVSLTDAAANARMTGDFTATRYGQEYQMLLRRNRAGPRVGNTGVLPAPDWQGYPFFPFGEF